MLGRLAILLLVAGMGYAQVKLACVDTNRILQESKLVAQAQKELREKLTEYQKKISGKEQRLEDLKKQIESKAISQSAREEKIKEYQRVEAEARDLQEKAQRELGEMKERLENMVFNRMREAAEKLARDRGYTGVMDCAVFLYREPGMDITTEIIRMIDEGTPKK